MAHQHDGLGPVVQTVLDAGDCCLDPGRRRVQTNHLWVLNTTKNTSLSSLYEEKTLILPLVVGDVLVLHGDVEVDSEEERFCKKAESLKETDIRSGDMWVLQQFVHLVLIWKEHQWEQKWFNLAANRNKHLEFGKQNVQRI